MKRKHETALMTITLIPIAYVISFILLSNYVGGDQKAYHRFYNVLNGAGIENVMNIASVVSSEEPLSAHILWAGSNFGIKKNIFISSLNVIMVVSLFLLARKHHVKILMIGLLLTNYYVVVLMTSAERLKIAYIFVILATLAAGKVRFLLLTISPLAHFQNIILLSSLVFSSFAGHANNLIFRGIIQRRALKLYSIVLITGVSFISFMLLKFQNEYGLWKKIIKYISVHDSSLFDLWKLCILIIITLYVTRRRLRMFLLFLPYLVGVYFIGGERINMIAFTVVIYYLMEERRLHHPLIYMLMLYFSIKTIPFIHKIILFGDGFFAKI
jgi:hypothetical protein